MLATINHVQVAAVDGDVEEVAKSLGNRIASLEQDERCKQVLRKASRGRSVIAWLKP